MRTLTGSIYYDIGVLLCFALVIVIGFHTKASPKP